MILIYADLGARHAQFHVCRLMRSTDEASSQFG